MAPSTTHPSFGADTTGLEVAQTFADRIQGRTILVTGVNLKGIGYTTAEAFASQAPACLILTGRSTKKLQECIDDLKELYPKVTYRALVCDLSNLKSVRASAAELASWDDVAAIDILVNNAGVMNIQTRTLSEDGYEMHLATNHIGPFLFTNLIMPKIKQAAKSRPRGTTRIINVSSKASEQYGIRWSDINFEKSNGDLPEAEWPAYKDLEALGMKVGPEDKYHHLVAYQQSKAANVLFSIALNRRLFESHGIASLSLHPGIITTELGRHLPKDTWEAIKKSSWIPWKSQAAGAATTMVAALDPGLGEIIEKDGQSGYGAYLDDCQISIGAHARARPPQEAEKLWALSESLVEAKPSL